jgi:hypothetical protein
LNQLDFGRAELPEGRGDPVERIHSLFLSVERVDDEEMNFGEEQRLVDLVLRPLQTRLAVVVGGG